MKHPTLSMYSLLKLKMSKMPIKIKLNELYFSKKRQGILEYLSLDKNRLMFHLSLGTYQLHNLRQVIYTL